MTNQEKIERLALFMHGEVTETGINEIKRLIEEDNWIWWRGVEEKLMEDEELWGYFRAQFDSYPSTLYSYMKATLEQRVDALISILPKL